MFPKGFNDRSKFFLKRLATDKKNQLPRFVLQNLL